MGGAASTTGGTHGVVGGGGGGGGGGGDGGQFVKRAGAVDPNVAATMQQLQARNQQLEAQVRQLQAEVSALKGTTPRTLAVLHFNDIYNLGCGKEEPIGGVSRFATALQEAKAKLSMEGLVPLVVFSGDMFGPSIISAITRGRHMVDVLDALDVHYGVFGNHEFDYGLQNLVHRIHPYTNKKGRQYTGSNVKWLATNLLGKDGKPLAGAHHSDLVTWNGIKIGVIGLCEDWLGGCSKLLPGEATYKDYIETGRAVARDLRSQGAEVVLAVTHNVLANDYKLTEAVPEIDLLLGGHDHFYKKNLAKRVVKSGQEFQYLSVVKITVHGSGKPLGVTCDQVSINADLAEDPVMDALVDKYDAEVHAKFAKVVGSSTVALDSRESALRFGECALGNLVADQACEDTHADCAIIFGFAISGKYVLDAGDVTVGDIYKWFPKMTAIISVPIKGSDIVASINKGIAPWPAECASWPHTSAQLTFTADMSSSDHNARVTEVLMNGKPIEADKVYTVAITAAMGKGRFGFPWFANQPRVRDEEFALLMTDILREEFRKHKHDEGGAVVSPPATGRATLLNTPATGGAGAGAGAM